MGSPLVSAAELAARLREVAVLDVRYRLVGPTGPPEFEAGHVPGAAYVDLDTALAAPPGVGGRHPLPAADVFVAAMRAAGVRRDRPVVVYDDWGGLAACRAWWLLRHFGHPDVRVLDGSWAAWRRSGGAVETGHPEVSPGDFTGGPGGMPTVDAATAPTVDVLIDVRAPERYRGEVEPIDPVAGHIPGAVNAPVAEVLTDGGLMRGPDELAHWFAGVGAVPGADVAAYCGSGVTAAQAVLALEVAGVRAALYPGSWSGWIADPRRPVETG